jgi:HD-like signal output (HDOD) protein
MSITPKAFLKGLDNLVVLPDVCFRINEMADDSSSSAVDMAEIIAQDPNLTAQLLRIANSPYYGFPSKVETISRAITVIGTQDLRDLVLSASMIKAFSTKPNELINMEKYWSHTLFTGLLSRELGSKTSTKILCKERLFVAGLLHDIGQLVMSIKIPELMSVMMYRDKAKVDPFFEIERWIFGIGHGEIGAQLMKQWNLPDSLQAVTKYHHEPEKADEHLLEVSIVHIADAMAHLANFSCLGAKEQVKISPLAWKVTGLDKQTVLTAVNKAKTEFKKSASAFIPFQRSFAV